MNAAPIFTRHEGEAGFQRYARWVDTKLPDGSLLHVCAPARLDEVEVGLMNSRSRLGFKVSAAEARALAAELLACADANDAARAAVVGRA
ncbi:MAG: hypothetical protein GAK34_03375 [Delftia tsuruhatensis]|nr:MAG: hypothetical protein GAK34_03375 [Delftia tsuruhatensis]